MPKLTYTVAGQQRTVEVTDSASIGRLEENAVALPDETGASRRHCQILKISSGYELSDLGSTNGTKVNGQKVKRHKLKPGDKIQIGETVLVWDEAGAAGDDVVLEGDVALEEPAGRPAAAPAGGGGTSEQCYLVFAGGPKDAQKVTLEKKRVTFGRNAKNTFVFEDDKGVSGYHCEISREGGAYVLRDLGSTNGTLVDGEPITEIALQHGNRIRIGGQRLVFVDPTVSDFEKAMSSVDDLGSEWGLLRAEMDMTRVQQARRSQIFGIVAAVVLLAGVGYVAMAHPDLLSGGEKGPQQLADNRFGADFSFEEGSGTWATPAGSPGQGRYVVGAPGSGAQGKTAYAVTRDGPPGRAAVVAGGAKERFPVDPQSSFVFGAHVRAEGDAVAAVRVAWLSADGTTVVGETATDLATASSWTELRRGVPKPPSEATTARVELLNAGSGTAYFDDVYFGPAKDGGARAVEAKDGDVSVVVGTDGQMTVRRGTRPVLLAAAPVAASFREDLGDSARPDRVGSRRNTQVSGSGASGRVTGETFDGRGRWQPFTVSATASEGRFLDLDLELGEDVAFLGTLPADVAAEGLGVKTEGGNFFRMTDARVVEKVREVTFGDRRPFQVAVREGSASLRFVYVRTDAGWAAGFGGAGKVLLRIDTDSEAILREKQKLEEAIRDALARRRLGDAVKAMRELALKEPAGSARAADLLQQAERHESQANAELQAIHTGRASAVEFQDDTALGLLDQRARLLVQGWEGHDVGKQADAEIAAIKDAIQKRRVVLHERRAAPILVKGKDYKARKEYAVASALFRSIVAQYPGTKAAKEAGDELASLPAGN